MLVPSPQGTHLCDLLPELDRPRVDGSSAHGRDGASSRAALSRSPQSWIARPTRPVRCARPSRRAHADGPGDHGQAAKTLASTTNRVVIESFAHQATSSAGRHGEMRTRWTAAGCSKPAHSGGYRLQRPAKRVIAIERRICLQTAETRRRLLSSPPPRSLRLTITIPVISRQVPHVRQPVEPART